MKKMIILALICKTSLSMQPDLNFQMLHAIRTIDHKKVESLANIARPCNIPVQTINSWLDTAKIEENKMQILLLKNVLQKYIITSAVASGFIFAGAMMNVQCNKNDDYTTCRWAERLFFAGIGQAFLFGFHRLHDLFFDTRQPAYKIQKILEKLKKDSTIQPPTIIINYDVAGNLSEKSPLLYPTKITEK